MSVACTWPVRCREAAVSSARYIDVLCRRGDISRKGADQAKVEVFEMWHRRSKEGPYYSAPYNDDYIVDSVIIDGKRWAIKAPLMSGAAFMGADFLIRRPPEFIPSTPTGVAKPEAPTPQRKLLLLTEK